ncbi:NRDE family protein [Geobacter sp.]|uniref:NRDE family protein n=1 Tax=Geobacter sp. TaxID=46610 RepID=UPI002630BEB3|nr:NRDE family protein [Geobacter sp.]
MCLILFALEAHPRYRLVLAANRDEFYDRPTAPASFWDDAPQVLAGRDLTGGGTWCGITTGGRIAAVTNYRDPRTYREGAPSRGRLVADFLRGEMTPAALLERLHREGNSYNGFNLIFGDGSELLYFSNRGALPARVPAGIHGLSNHLLDTPWPKVARGKEALAKLLAARDEPAPDDLFAILADRTPAPDHLLPDTGVGPERERLLSPLFIATPTYGSRSSTVILIGRDNTCTFVERSFNGAADHPRTVKFRFTIALPVTFPVR